LKGFQCLYHIHHSGLVAYIYYTGGRLQILFKLVDNYLLWVGGFREDFLRDMSD
jgi:hypothetical protein